MKFEKKRLTDIDKKQIIELCDHSLVKKHMPLSTEHFGEKEYQQFIQAKEKMWQQLGFGASAYLVDGKFIGWGGLQPENDDFEIAIVLHPDYWGYGSQIVKELIQFAFETLKLKSVIILFPPSRTRIKGILKLGFKQDGEINIEGELFIRYRLFAGHQNLWKN